MPANQKLLSFGALPYSSPYYSIGIEDCINYYVEISPTQSSKVEHYYVSIPGLQMFSQPTGQNPCRGI